MRKIIPYVLIGIALSSGATAASAQAPGPWSVDLSMGPGFGSTDGEYLDDGSGTTAEILAAVRLRQLGGAGLVAALGIGMRSGGATTLVCLLRPSGGCVPDFPDFAVISAGVGLETPGGMLRGFVGPAIVHADATAVAASGRVDLAIRVIGPAWLQGSVGGVLVPDYRGDSFLLGNVGIGIRIR